ncbi:tetratricopeptide repeat protein [Halomarina ordinaria]|uniref:Tetratricopeptide repeat protein n=1 Tax=Halomarina ordinaria TaxID=3033939 RepID=A0ABD5UAU3_9EURY|nr:tetratricopeptide repeat protein [Halomarina sp. PSRA2]
MESDATDERFVRLLERRAEFLVHLGDEPQRKPALVEALGRSRSTVDRALRELEHAGLVERHDGGYATTLAGRLAEEAYRTFVETTSTVVAADALLDALPAECEWLDPAVLAGAEYVPTDDLTPYELPAALRETVETADRLTALVPVVADPKVLALCHDHVDERGLDLVVGPALYETLETRFPETLRGLVDGGATVVRTDEEPPCTLLLSSGEEPRVACVAYDGDASVGVCYNDTAAARAAAERYVEAVRADATDVTASAGALDPGDRRLTAGPTDRHRDDRLVLEREGFVELTDDYFAERSPCPPPTSWRTGLDLAEVAAGYAVDRTYDEAGERRALTADLLAGLRAGRDHALVGPPGAGKSTVCKTVAYRWYEAGVGTVLYRRRGRGEPFTSAEALRARLREATGRALVVVEDALREDAVAVFGAMAEYRDDPSVTFLLDARESEWEDPTAFPADARAATHRAEAVERVHMPPLDATECERLVRHFEATTGRRVDLTVEDLVSGLDGDGEAADLLVVLHRLVLSVDPLAGYGSATPTTLTEDVARTFERLREAGEHALDVGVLVNVLNAAEVGVSPDLVYALAAREDDDAPGFCEVAEALDLLSGRVLFEREAPGDGEAAYRSVHESWSSLFLRHLLECDGDRAAERRFGRVVSALLSLADDETARARIEWEFQGAAPAIRELSEAPGEWADATVERLFGLGLSRPALAPLFGTSPYTSLALPEACSPALAVRCTQWRGEMSLRAGRLEAAEREFERLGTFADEAADDARAAALRARSLKFRGTVALRRSEFDDAEAFYEQSIGAYRACDDEQGEADVVNNLGIVAWSRGDLPEAEAYLRDCLSRYREMGNRRAAADARFNLATVLDSRSVLEEAADHYRDCLAYFRSTGDRRTEADTLNNLGSLWRVRGDLDAAERDLTQALDTYRDIGDELGEANCLHNLGCVAQQRGELERSVEYHERSLERYRAVGDTQGVAQCECNIGDVAYRRGDLDEAEARYERSLDRRQGIGDGIGEAESLANLGRVARDRGDTDRGRDFARRALDRYRDSADVRGEGEALRLLGSLARTEGDLDRAAERLRASLARCREGGHRYGEAETLVERGHLARAWGDDHEAEARYAEALDLFTDIGALRDVIDTHLALTAACEALGERAAAIDHCEAAVVLGERNGVDVSEARDRLRRLEEVVSED